MGEVPGELGRLPSARERFITSLSRTGLVLSCAISVALVLGLATVDSHASWLAWLRLTLGCLVGAEGYVLSTNWRGSRDRTTFRIASTGRWQKLGSRTSVGSLLISLVLQLLGVIWVGAGLFSVAKAVEVLL